MILRVKAGVVFTVIDAAGFRLLGALEAVARALPFDLTLTCACEGHLPTDPHTLGRAYDVRSHDLAAADKARVLRAVLLALQASAADAPVETAGGLATVHFFGWLERAGAPTEHLHFQRRHGVVYP